MGIVAERSKALVSDTSPFEGVGSDPNDSIFGLTLDFIKFKLFVNSIGLEGHQPLASRMFCRHEMQIVQISFKSGFEIKSDDRGLIKFYLNW